MSGILSVPAKSSVHAISVVLMSTAVAVQSCHELTSIIIGPEISVYTPVLARSEIVMTPTWKEASHHVMPIWDRFKNDTSCLSLVDEVRNGTTPLA